MKKTNLTGYFKPINIKFDLKMRLTVVLLFVALFQINANNTYSQKTKISVDVVNTPISEIFSEIEKKTEFNIFYNNATIDLSRKVSIHAKNKSVKTILEKIFKDTDITFDVLNKQIILLKKDNKPILLSFKNSSKTILLQKEISGTVTDENGEPLPGATVLIKGTNLGISTDFDGKYSLAVPAEATALIFSYVGYETKEVAIENNVLINVQLQPSIASLDEVVLVGYGNVKREALTGSVGTVDVKKIANQSPVINLDNALQGQVAGVYVSSATGQPGAASRIRIRGTTSLFGSNQPLYVIDGIPVTVDNNIPIGGAEGQQLGNELAQEGISTPIGNINSADIETISVLKDASAAAIYGSRAANGVIIINTKQGVYDGKPSFDVSLSTTTQTPRTLDVLNAAQFREVWTTAVNNSTSTAVFANEVRDGSYFGNADTNWEDEVSPGSPVSTFFNLGVYGGSKSIRYSSSIGVNTQNGIYDNSGFDRYSYNLNVDSDINKIWKIGTKMNVSMTDQQSLDPGLTQLIYNFRPDISIYNEDGTYAYSPYFNSENPVARSKASNDNKTLLVLGSFYTQLQLAKGLNIKTMFSLNYNNGNQYSFYPRYTFTGGWSRLQGDGDGYAQESRSRITNTVWDTTLNYDNTIGEDHYINGVAGVSFEKRNYSWVKAWGEGFFNDVFTNISNATISNSGSSYAEHSGLVSYFGRINYDYKSKYLLTLSGRVDGSSKFASGNQYAFFPAAAFAWRVSEEPFLADNKTIDELKLRMSLGKTGQQDFGSYAWRTLFEAYDYGLEPSVILSQLGNDDLKWETTNQFDLGIDFSLLENRLRGTLGYYTKETVDALFYVQLPGSTGYSTTIANVGNTQNKGIELELKGDIIRTPDFTWTLGFNANRNRNKLTKINDDFLGDDGYVTGFTGGGYLKEGSPIGLLYGYVADGLFQDQSEIDALNANSPTGVYQNNQTSPGDIKFVDISGPDGVPDGRITSLDQRAIGDTQPELYGGISNELRYKGLSLSAFFTYSIGNDLYAFGRSRSTNFGSTFLAENKEIDVLNAWSPENTNTSIPRVVYLDPNDNDRLSSHYAYEASFLRLKTINLTYSFSKKMLENFKFIDRASVYVTGQNLWTMTNYPGADPEASNLYNNDISSGRDNNRFPVAKIFTAGIRIGF